MLYPLSYGGRKTQRKSTSRAEDAGRGIDVMFDTMQTELLDPPEIMEDGHAVTVRLRLSSTISPSERAWLRELLSRGEIEAPDRMVLVQAARGAALTNRHVRELLDVDSVQARRVLQRLRSTATSWRRSCSTSPLTDPSRTLTCDARPGCQRRRAVRCSPDSWTRASSRGRARVAAPGTPCR